MDSETVDNLLDQIAAILQEHTVIAVNHRHTIEHLSKEVAQLKTRLEKLEASDSNTSKKTISIEEVDARLKVIIDMLWAKY